MDNASWHRKDAIRKIANEYGFEAVCYVVQFICSNEYLTVNQIAASIGKNVRYLKKEILFSMLKGKLVQLYPSKPKYPNQAYKANHCLQPQQAG